MSWRPLKKGEKIQSGDEYRMPVGDEHVGHGPVWHIIRLSSDLIGMTYYPESGAEFRRRENR